ncbi:MAG: hypothetical protein IPL08_00300 [Saprospiraceae bacterium]|nr:hypothetical protein [Saprospiraceae bacterium]
MKKENVTDLTVTRVQGGMIEFEQTGKYPDYLHFHSSYYRHSWKQACTSDHQEGALKMEGKPVYEYKLSDSHCNIRAILDDDSYSDWFIVDIDHVLQD